MIWKLSAPRWTVNITICNQYILIQRWTTIHFTENISCSSLKFFSRLKKKFVIGDSSWIGFHSPSKKSLFSNVGYLTDGMSKTLNLLRTQIRMPEFRILHLINRYELKSYFSSSKHILDQLRVPKCVQCSLPFKKFGIKM